jgi:hypothetical protein
MFINQILTQISFRNGHLRCQRFTLSIIYLNCKQNQVSEEYRYIVKRDDGFTLKTIIIIFVF